tara:strand:- start:1052 stop:1378 length:327 start_codon:yes stop_codon:yes gene_type:complete
MKFTKTYHILEYLSLVMILSYFLVHNIFLVITGICSSLLLININYINRLMKPINRKIIKDFNKNNKEKKSDSIIINSKKEVSQLSLVETVEELGYIPSIDKNNSSKAA